MGDLGALGRAPGGGWKGRREWEEWENGRDGREPGQAQRGSLPGSRGRVGVSGPGRLQGRYRVGTG